MTSNNIPVPKSIADTFDHAEVLSAIGGMGLVFKCMSEDRVTAVKCIKEDPNDLGFIARFKRDRTYAVGVRL